MNLILFDEDELADGIPCDDARMVHVTKILRLNVDDEFLAGIVGGQIGHASLISRKMNRWKIRFNPVRDSTGTYPVTVLLGCPRPPVARRLLKDLSTLGVGKIIICSTDLNEKSYLSSRLWRDGLYKFALLEGAMQGGVTHLPSVTIKKNLSSSLKVLPEGKNNQLIALDNNQRAIPLSGMAADFRQVVLAVGPERGWTDRERGILEGTGFTLIQLGKRILRTETACSVGVGLVLEQMGVYSTSTDSLHQTGFQPHIQSRNEGMTGVNTWR